MARRSSARSTVGHFASPRINDLTIAASSLLQPALKRLLDLREELLARKIVAKVKLGPRAPGTKRAKQCHNGDHVAHGVTSWRRRRR